MSVHKYRARKYFVVMTLRWGTPAYTRTHCFDLDVTGTASERELFTEAFQHARSEINKDAANGNSEFSPIDENAEIGANVLFYRIALEKE